MAPRPPLSVWIGFDMREAAAFAVARHSIQTNTFAPLQVRGVVLPDLIAAGLYQRPMLGYQRMGQPAMLIDEISGAPMSTAFAISRFFVPMLAKTGWALFMDCDVLVRADLMDLFAQVDSSKALMCVKHHFDHARGVKMDGQAQQPYPRKNWSSVMLINCDHPANRALDLALLNSATGRDLHRFCWLEDDLIGELHPKWNWLVGHSDPLVDPAIVHFTDGGPWFPGFEHVPFASEWTDALTAWASSKC